MNESYGWGHGDIAADGGWQESLRLTVKYTAIMISIFMMMIMMWEHQKNDAAALQTAIPQESIRLRILANSDGAGDQLVKREIRDALVAQMNGWVEELDDPQSLSEAQALVRRHLPEMEKLVGRELAARGLAYSYKVELGTVPFPTKMYGGTVYPAGDYEAVRVTLGAGLGQNWWCVLFPPLCFIVAGTGEAAAVPGTVSAEGADNGADNVKQTAASGDGGAVSLSEAGGGEPEVKFWVWETMKKIGDWIGGLFA